MQEIRLQPRHEFEFFVIEHRPEGVEHPQATRTLKCLDFSKGGLRLAGASRYQRFTVTMCLPPQKEKVDVEVEVVHQGFDSFGVKFILPSGDLLSKIDWWNSSAGLSFLEDDTDV